MKIAIKYGLVITAVVVLWIIVVRFILDVSPNSKVNLIAPIVFNLTAILAILQGMRARKSELAGDLFFKEGIKTGMRISVVYAISACLFFILEFLVAGPNLPVTKAHVLPMWEVAAFDCGVLFVGALVFGLIYSTLIAFFLARRLPRESSQTI